MTGGQLVPARQPDDEADTEPSRRRQRRGPLAQLHAGLAHRNPAKMLLLGYVSYMLIGWAVLSLPPFQQVPVAALDALFIATSAVSTTGLVTIDPGGSFTFWGELVILALIQIGGLGYMTIGSFAVLAIQHRLSSGRARTLKAAFNLPPEIRPIAFLRAVVLFTLAVEAAGALALYLIFSGAGVEDAAWMAIFHAVSAFCTAGFSLFPNSLEDFAADPALVAVISALSLMGAMGFLIVVDAWRNLQGRKRHLGFTSKVIFRITMILLALGTGLVFVAEPAIAALPADDRLLAAFFQVMTATTTVGFNTVPIGALAPAVLLVLIVLMAIGASPAGTGGGLKTTSFAVLLGLVRSTLKGRDEVRFAKRRVPADKLQTATASLAYFIGVLIVALVLLLLTEQGQSLDALLFEAVSAMGTVGLSQGVTGDLSPLGKLILVVLMTAGRVGLLTFGIALATHDESRDEVADNTLVM